MCDFFRRVFLLVFVVVHALSSVQVSSAIDTICLCVTELNNLIGGVQSDHDYYRNGSLPAYTQQQQQQPPPSAQPPSAVYAHSEPPTGVYTELTSVNARCLRDDHQCRKDDHDCYHNYNVHVIHIRLPPDNKSHNQCKKSRPPARRSAGAARLHKAGGGGGGM